MSSFNDPIARKKALIEAAKARSVKPEDAVLTTVSKKEYIPPSEAVNKIRIFFDNSGSMNSFIKGVDNKSSDKCSEAKKGVVEFLRNCALNKDAVAVHLLNTPHEASWDYEEQKSVSTAISPLLVDAELTTDLVRLALAVDTPAVHPTGDTPLYQVILKGLNDTPQATRAIAFSDGQPDSWGPREEVISVANEKKIPIDTVYFGDANERGAQVMKDLAEATGGIYIAFDPAKGVNFAQAFKYLSPGKRLMLMNAEFKAKLERGEVK